MKKNRKKKRIVIIMGLSLILMLNMALFISAGERAIVPDMNFIGEVIEFSLEDAIKVMQTQGSRAETALINKTADEAVAKGHVESVQSMVEYWKRMEEGAGGASIAASIEAERAGMTETNEKIAKMRRDFAKEQINNNYKAELNDIEVMTVQLYYGILLAEENLKIAKDSLANTNRVDENIQKKYQQGTVAKIDTITSKNQVKQAEGNVSSAETALKNAKMNFNILMGYDSMQNIKTKDSLSLKEAPEGNLTKFIEAALDNRNEIKSLKMAFSIQDILLASLKYRYPENSATYLNQKAATLQAKKSYEDIPIQIEQEVRSMHMDLIDKKRDVELAKENVKIADEVYRISQISFDAGINTLTDVQESGIRSYQAALSLAAAITDYNLTVHNFKHAISIGTMRVPL